MTERPRRRAISDQICEVVFKEHELKKHELLANSLNMGTRERFAATVRPVCLHLSIDTPNLRVRL